MDPDDKATVIIRDTPQRLWNIALMAVEGANAFSTRKRTTVTYYGVYRARVVKNENSFTVKVWEIQSKDFKNYRIKVSEIEP